MPVRSQPFNLAIVVPFAELADREIYATTKPQRADQARLDRTRMRLRLSQHSRAAASRQGQPLSVAERVHSGLDASGRQTNHRCSERPAAVAELLR